MCINIEYFKILTPRELEVMNLIAQGKNHEEIGENLSISLATVKMHVFNIYSKMQIQKKDKVKLIIAYLSWIGKLKNWPE